MAWSGSCSEFEDEYDGDGYWDYTETDLEDLPDEELIVELRDEQNSIKEAQRLIHKEIKSIRRELKHLFRYHAATHPLRDAVDQHVDSGVGESNYNTASEVASSYGDSEVGYPGFEYDTDMSAAGYKRSHRAQDYEGRGEFNDNSSNVSPSYKHRNRRANHEYESSRSVGLGQNWEADGTSTAPEDHAWGKNSNDEDVYGMVRRRHEVDSQNQKSQSKGLENRWKSIVKKRRKNVMSVPESDHDDSRMPHLRQRCRLDENSGDLEDFQNVGYDDPGRSSNHNESRDLNHNVTRRELVDGIDEQNDKMPYKDIETTQPRLAVLKTIEATQHRLRPCGGPPSAVSDQSSMWDTRTGATNLDDESAKPATSYGRSLQTLSGITCQTHHSEQPYLDEGATLRLKNPKFSFSVISSSKSSSSDESRYERQEIITNARENKTHGYRRRQGQKHK